MKRFFSYTLCLLVVLCCTTNMVSAANKSRQARKELKVKVDRDSKRSAKALTKEGWRVMPGALPLKRQIMESKLAMVKENSDHQRVNIVASSKSKGGDFNAAKRIAQHQARTELANNISSDLKDIIKDSLLNIDLGDDDIETIRTFIAANESLSSMLLRDVVVVYEAYREQSKFVEVSVSIYISKKQIVHHLRNEMRNSLDEATKKIATRMQKI